VTLKPSHFEMAIRTYALQDAFVGGYQQRIDQQRLAYFKERAYAQSSDCLHAIQMAKVFYSIYIGRQHIIPHPLLEQSKRSTCESKNASIWEKLYCKVTNDRSNECCPVYYPSRSKVSGSSTSSLMRTRNCTASRPSTIR